jgi:hypothetical protein
MQLSEQSFRVVPKIEKLSAMVFVNVLATAVLCASQVLAAAVPSLSNIKWQKSTVAPGLEWDSASGVF